MEVDGDGDDGACTWPFGVTVGRGAASGFCCVCIRVLTTSSGQVITPAIPPAVAAVSTSSWNPISPLSNPPLSQLLLLLVERKLQCREGHVTEQRCLEAGEEGKKAFGAQYRSEGICRRSIVVSRFEERVIISALKLQPGLQHFGRNVYKRRSKIGNESCTDLS